ncbi:sacsin N-terminal ATP-binding-like domain-containing protein [Halostreptopolyspora alba]|uniref:ATP-binding protein n=1 Tax=Halostreptopolyspora alba TaxID=2487137 RepID=A0A3N0E828_9ACTN|nr:ATP-binding protein [Nocardiopsaceae bacterium YIM 96095]
MGPTQADPFDTAELRRRVLDGWADAPARFREDANAEEDYALGGYRDRVVVELAQNAADAARRAGEPGRLHLALEGAVLTVSNTGSPLTAAGVESLATLRASAKRDDGAPGSTGRFGVGFSAVAAVSDSVTVASHDGAVRFDLDQARSAVSEELLESGRARPELADEIRRRGGHVPLLRLPFATAAGPLGSYDTVVTLVLRDEGARDRLGALLDETSEALLLALPDLAEVRITTERGERVLTRAPEDDAGGTVTRVRDSAGERATQWRTVTRTGRFDSALLADRPTEERTRLDWALTWAVPVTASGALAGLPDNVARVVHAPTPSDAELDIPALLIGTFPLSPDRRDIAPGPATETLIAAAADSYCELLCQLDARVALDLVPATAIGGGEFDGRFRGAVAKPLLDTPFLVTEKDEPVRPRDAIVLEGGPAVTAVAADVLPTVLPGAWDPRHPALAQLRLRRVGLAELADLLADLDRDPLWWAGLYAALGEAGRHGADLGELGALPVPLVDGRLVRGPRSLLVPVDAAIGDGTLTPEALAALGPRIVHPRAADPLLVRLGAVEATASAALTDPRTRAAVENSLDADDPDEVAAPVLDLVAASGTTIADAPWLSELALRDDEGGYSVAGELLLPESPLVDILSDEAPFGIVAADLVERYGSEALEAVGAHWSFTLVRANDVALGPGLADTLEQSDQLDSVEAWAEEIVDRLGSSELPPVVGELVAVADLEYVRDDRWPQALELLSGSRLRPAVVEPARVLGGEGQARDVPSYTAWWLRTGAKLEGRRPTELRTSDAETALHGLYDEAPTGVDSVLARAVGVRTSLDTLLAEPDGPDDLLERLADPGRHVEREALREIWSSLAQVDADRVTPPERVRAVRGGSIVVADAEETIVVDTPDLLPLLTERPVVLVPPHRTVAVADVLDLALASEELEGHVTSTGHVQRVPEEVNVVLAEPAALTYVHHEELTVDGVDAEWRYDGSSLHASTTDGLARALCWASGQWPRRHLVAAVLRDPRPGTLSTLLAETDFD